MGPHPTVAAIRLAVRRTLQTILQPGPGTPVGVRQDASTPRGVPAAPPGGAPAPYAAPTQYSPPSHSPQNSPQGSAPHGGAPQNFPPAPDATGQGVPAARDRRQQPLVLAACSGGADSTALAAALAFEASRLGLRAGAVTVDHGLQPGSAERAREVAERLTALGLEPVEIATVAVGREGGPEAAARTARYAALDAAAERLGAAAVLLGHTRDDQAETVLLGLARGSGTRSLAGMPAASDGPAGTPDAHAGPGGPFRPGPPAAAVPLPAGRRYRRPFLTVDRATTRRACTEMALPIWDDPHNSDPAYTRSRIRHEALPVLEKTLGRGVTEALARTAQLARDDADALDSWAAHAERIATRPDGTLDIAALHALPPAVRRRVLRRAAIAAGAPAGSLFARHIEETDRLITAWHGQRPLNLPGRVEARRQGGRLVLEQANR